MKKLLIVLLSWCVLAVPFAGAADLTITAAQVEALTSTTTVSAKVQVGEAVTTGQGVYKKTSDGKYYLASNDVDAATATAAGISLCGAATNGYIVIVTAGEMDLGATLTPGRHYLVSATPGGIGLEADLASTNYLTSWGVAVASDKFIVNIKVTGYQKP